MSAVSGIKRELSNWVQSGLLKEGVNTTKLANILYNIVLSSDKNYRPLKAQFRAELVSKKALYSQFSNEMQQYKQFFDSEVDNITEQLKELEYR